MQQCHGFMFVFSGVLGWIIRMSSVLLLVKDYYCRARNFFSIFRLGLPSFLVSSLCSCFLAFLFVRFLSRHSCSRPFRSFSFICVVGYTSSRCTFDKNILAPRRNCHDASFARAAIVGPTLDTKPRVDCQKKRWLWASPVLCLLFLPFPPPSCVRNVVSL